MGGPCNSSISSLASSNAAHTARSELRLILRQVIAETGLSQARTAKLCSTDQPTLSKILSGRSDSVSTEQLIRWLVQLGCNIEIKIQRRHGLTAGMIKAVFDE